VLDLGSKLKSLQAKGFYEFIGKTDPVSFGKSDVVCIEISGSSTEFGTDRDLDQQLDGVFYSLYKDH
jgi:hypothetical protein